MEAGHLGQIAAVGLGRMQILQLQDTLFLQHAPGQGSITGPDRLGLERRQKFRWHLVGRHRAEGSAAIGFEHRPIVGPAKAHGTLDQGLKHGVQVEARATDELEYLGGGALLFPCLGSLGDALLQRVPGPQIGKRNTCLSGQQREQVGVGVAEAADPAVHIGIQQTQQVSVGEQGGEHARALIDRRNTLRPMAQARGPGTPRLGQPGRDRALQLASVLAAWQFRAAGAQALFRLEQQHDAPSTADACCDGKQMVTKLLDRARSAERQCRVGQQSVPILKALPGP